MVVKVGLVPFALLGSVGTTDWEGKLHWDQRGWLKTRSPSVHLNTPEGGSDRHRWEPHVKHDRLIWRATPIRGHVTGNRKRDRNMNNREKWDLQFENSQNRNKKLKKKCNDPMKNLTTVRPWEQSDPENSQTFLDNSQTFTPIDDVGSLETPFLQLNQQLYSLFAPAASSSVCVCVGHTPLSNNRGKAGMCQAVPGSSSAHYVFSYSAENDSKQTVHVHVSDILSLLFS